LCARTTSLKQTETTTLHGRIRSFFITRGKVKPRQNSAHKISVKNYMVRENRGRHPLLKLPLKFIDAVLLGLQHSDNGIDNPNSYRACFTQHTYLISLFFQRFAVCLHQLFHFLNCHDNGITLLNLKFKSENFGDFATLASLKGA